MSGLPLSSGAKLFIFQLKAPHSKLDCELRPRSTKSLLVRLQTFFLFLSFLPCEMLYHQPLPCLCYLPLREHLSVRGFSWWIRCFSINTVLLILLFFLTTPAIIISTMDKFNVTKPVENLNVSSAAGGVERSSFHMILLRIYPLTMLDLLN